MLDHDKVPKGPMSLSCLNAQNANLTNTMNTMNANITLNAMNANAIEHRFVNSKVVDLVISTDNKVTSINAKVVTVKSITSNCMSMKSIYDSKCFQACASRVITVRSRYLKFACDKIHQIQLPFTENYQHNDCSSGRHWRDREPSRIPTKKICRLLTE